MELLSDVLAFLSDGQHWLGSRGIFIRLWEHVYISVGSTAVAAALAVPPAMLLAHGRRGAFIANALVNVGRAVPSFGIVVLAAPITLRFGLGLASWPTFLALLALALPPIFTNTYTGIAGVDPSVVDAARGMGMTERDILLRIELPNAAPVVLAGIRIAFVQVIATATIGAVLTFGGLGRFIIDGFAKGAAGEAEVLVGALLVALLALGAERAFTVFERRFLPAGVRRLVRTADVAGTAPAA
jgi:osmoprotectant transport system permease protein